MPGPLHGLRIIELAGIGPGPFAGMLLADLGAEVVRVERPGGNPSAGMGHDILNRSRRSVAVNLKDPAGVEVILRLVDGADGLFEGNRPGVAERLGVGPDVCLERNPRLVYGRMTGWGQDGPWADRAGHDINYIALAGVLDTIGRKDSGPVPPLNLVGDFGGGAMMLALGMVAGLLHAARTGEGQVVDAAMVEGAALLQSMQLGLSYQGMWGGGRGGNLLDTGAHFYDVYETADGRWISLGAIEPQFHAEMLDRLGLTDELGDKQYDVANWDAHRKRIAEVVAGRTRDDWDEVFAGSDACYAPVLEMHEAMDHPHNVARGTFVEVDGQRQPRPVPRFSTSVADAPSPTTSAGAHTRDVLTGAGFHADEIADLLDRGVIAQD